MNKIFSLFLLAGSMLLNNCGSRHNNKIDSLSELKEASEKTAEAVQKANDRWQERRQKGDTLAMAYTDLQKYLPDIPGYQRSGSPQGSQMNVPGMGSWSQTKQSYDNGEKHISVEIMDYNGAQPAFAGATAAYSMGISSEDDEKKEEAADLGIAGVAAYQTVYKQQQEAKLVLIVADRFLVEIDSDGTNDIDLLKSAAKAMNLEELAGK